VVEACTLQTLKVNHQAILFSGAGFFVGFAVCYYLQNGRPESLESSSARVAFSQQLPSLTFQTATASQASWITIIAPPFSRSDSVIQNKDSLVIHAKTSRWRIKVWHPTIPPQFAGEFDPLEYAAAVTAYTNR